MIRVHPVEMANEENLAVTVEQVSMDVLEMEAERVRVVGQDHLVPPEAELDLKSDQSETRRDRDRMQEDWERVEKLCDPSLDLRDRAAHWDDLDHEVHSATEESLVSLDHEESPDLLDRKDRLDHLDLLDRTESMETEDDQEKLAMLEPKENLANLVYQELMEELDIRDSREIVEIRARKVNQERWAHEETQERMADQEISDRRDHEDCKDQREEVARWDQVARKELMVHAVHPA